MKTCGEQADMSSSVPRDSRVRKNKKRKVHANACTCPFPFIKMTPLFCHMCVIQDENSWGGGMSGMPVLLGSSPLPLVSLYDVSEMMR
jgi:hypothetical protein